MLVWCVVAWFSAKRTKEYQEKLLSELKLGNEQYELANKKALDVDKNSFSAKQYDEQALQSAEQWDKQLALLECIAIALEKGPTRD